MDHRIQAKLYFAWFPLRTLPGLGLIYHFWRLMTNKQKEKKNKRNVKKENGIHFYVEKLIATELRTSEAI